jgi:histone chaperone ASF1
VEGQAAEPEVVDAEEDEMSDDGSVDIEGESEDELEEEEEEGAEGEGMDVDMDVDMDKPGHAQQVMA